MSNRDMMTLEDAVDYLREAKGWGRERAISELQRAINTGKLPFEGTARDGLRQQVRRARPGGPWLIKRVPS